MHYRSFGQIDFRVSALGFGCMRLPSLGDPSCIDEPEAIRMIRHAIDNGVNYLDTAYMYHGGNSERVLGKALRDGYRDRVRVATKLPVGIVREAGDFDRIFDAQLEKLGVDRVDFYLLHGLRSASWDHVRDLGVTGWAEARILDGRIGRLGFSFHDSPDVFRRIVDEYDDWALAQVQYNFMDVENQAGTAGVRYAASKGLAIVVMEPLLGGRLASPPDHVQAIYDRASIKRTAAEWALQWLWDQPEVSTVLSGMTAFPQVVENLASASRSGVGTLTDDERAVIAAARDAYDATSPVPCTQCRYCMPCPNGVDIPWNFLIFNRAIVYDLYEQSRRYRYATSPIESRASACIACGECEEKCPQSIRISDWMSVVHKVLGENVDYDPTMAPR